MKRRQLLKHLKEHGCEFYRESGKHTVYWNPENNQTTTIPRHTEIEDRLAQKICRDLGIPKP